ncbi:MAG: NAD kinase [Alphaproteobacteria bacterium]|nr:NAD kinase [Alphaproteobacteria bacterium]
MTGATRFAFFASDTDGAIEAAENLRELYGESGPEDADVFVVLGGDGTMLETLHKTIDLDKPVYGMNRGSVGFLLNPYRKEGLTDRVARSESVTIHPLRMKATALDGTIHEALAFNEVSLFRESRYAAKISITVDDVERLEELVCDGVLVSTPAGSTAYNLSAHGPILPLKAELLAITPISAFRPRRWRGALLPGNSTIRFKAASPEKRPVSAAADFIEVRDIAEVAIHESRSISRTLLFDPDHNLEERILKEQFLV